MWWKPLFLTFQLLTVSITVAAVMGIVAAWAGWTASTSGRIGRFASKWLFLMIVAALVTPLILHAAAWEATAGRFSWSAMTQTGTRSFGSFGGLLACGWIHGVTGSAIVALATWHGVRTVPSAVIEQSQLDAGPVITWWRIRLPIAMPWVTGALLATAALVTTEMTVVDLYGFRTIADEFYLYWSADPTLGSLSVFCALPMLIGIAMFVLSLHWRRSMLAGELASPARSTSPQEMTTIGQMTIQWVAIIIAIVASFLMFAVPLGGLLIKAGHEVTVVGDQVQVTWSIVRCIEVLLRAPATFAAEYQWTAILAIGCAVTAVGIAWPLAAIGRVDVRCERVIDCATIIMVLIPGPIVGLAVVRFFQLDIPSFDRLFQQTLLPSIMALLVRAVPVSYWIMRTGYRGVSDTVLQAAALETGWWSRWWQIDRPLLWPSLAMAGLASAVVASGDVPVMLPVLPPGVTTVGTRLFGLLHSGARYQEAALAFWHVLTIVVITGVSARWVFPGEKKSQNVK